MTSQRYLYSGFTFIGAEDLASFRIFLNIFNDVDQVGNFREERIVVCKANSGFIVVAWLADIKNRLHVRIDKSEENI